MNVAGGDWAVPLLVAQVLRLYSCNFIAGADSRNDVGLLGGRIDD